MDWFAALTLIVLGFGAGFCAGVIHASKHFEKLPKSQQRR